MKYSLSQIRTKNEAETVVRDIDTLIESYDVDRYKDHLRNVSNLTQQLLTTDDVIIITKSDLKELKQKIEEMPTISLTISVIPTQKLLSSLKDWLFSHYQKEFLLDIETDSRVIGGAKITFDGKYKDYSLERTLSEMFTNKSTQ